MKRRKYLSACLKNLRNFDGYRLVQLVVYSIAILAAFHAVDYFARRSDLDIRVVKSMNPEIRLALVREFYEVYDLPTTGLIECGLYLSDVDDNSKNIRETVNLSSGSPENSVLAAVQKGRLGDGPFLRRQILELEGYQNDSTYRKYSYSMDGLHYVLSKDHAANIRNKASSGLDPKQYYILLCALKRSQTHTNRLEITNSGDIDLYDLNIIVPAPMSRITGACTGNILKYIEMGNTPAVIDLQDDRIGIFIQQLRKREGKDITIVTRENMILSDDIRYTYRTERIIDRGRALVSFSVILISVLLVSGIFRGENKG